MLNENALKVEHFAALAEADAAIARAVAMERCPHCNGPLHQGNYKRKPRGGLFAGAAERFSLRHSLCCGWRGCRKRTLPPSLRFLGRRVYLEVVVLFASACAQVAAALSNATEKTGVPTRTLRRWLSWWRDELPRRGWWAQLRAQFVPPGPDEATLPRSLIEHLREVAGASQLAWLAAKCLAPGTTSMDDAARFVRDAAGDPQAI
jgi:hypothetical protein